MPYSVVTAQQACSTEMVKLRMNDTFKILIKCKNPLLQLALKTKINSETFVQYFVQTSLLVSVGVCFGMDERGVDPLGNRRPLEVDSNNSLTSDVTVAYNTRSSQTSTFGK